MILSLLLMAGTLAGAVLGFQACLHLASPASRLPLRLRRLRRRLRSRMDPDADARLAEMNRLRRSESDLRESEAFSRALFHAAHAGLVVVNLTTDQIMEANETAAAILGLDTASLLGMPSRDAGLQLIGHELALRPSGFRAVKTELLRPGGEPTQVLMSAAVFDDEANLCLASFLDIGPLTRAEDELRRSKEKLETAHAVLEQQKDAIVQSEKMASIGQLAAGVAHEINNPIGYVSSNLGTVLEYTDTMKALIEQYEQAVALPPGSPDRDAILAHIEQIREEEDLAFILGDLDTVLTETMDGVHRVAEIVQNLKSFARADTCEIMQHDVNEGIESMIRMVWNELKYHCEIARDLGELPLVTCHGGKINQVVMNMLVNAAHAIDPNTGGTITVRTRALEDEVEISITDDGRGMPPEVASRVFDPFFTTKEVGSGTGLGLSISHGIVADHGGRIEVETALGSGTTFTIFLPVTAAVNTIG